MVMLVVTPPPALLTLGLGDGGPCVLCPSLGEYEARGDTEPLVLSPPMEEDQMA